LTGAKNKLPSATKLQHKPKQQLQK